MTEFQIKLNHTQSCLMKSTKELLDCVAKINTGYYNATIFHVVQCLTTQNDHDVFFLKWVNLSTLTLNEKTYIDFSSLLSCFRYKEIANNNYNRMRGWYFYVNRKQGSIDYIGVGGAKESGLNDYNDLYHRISQHFGTSTGATFCKNYYRNDTIPTREEWIKTLKENYDLMVIYAKESDIGEDALYVIESFLIGIFQPKYNRQ